jgi:hypothetical protein
MPGAECAGPGTLLGTMRKGAQVFAEAEGADALLERGAVAALKATEERLELEGTGDVLLNFGEFPGGEFFPARSDGRVVTKAAEEKLDFGEGEAHVAGKADKQDAIKGVSRVAALATDALGRGEEAAFLVETDGGGLEVGASGELADFHD